jgi:hypothetical protein
LQHGREGLQEGFLGTLGLHQAGIQGIGNAGQAKLAQGAFDLDHGHVLNSVVEEGFRVGGAAPRANNSA